MRIHLCGVRGSTPSPARGSLGVGGHTSCVAIAHDGEPAPRLVLDAGTGLRELTNVLAGDPFTGTIVCSHVHWDHVMGLPFFRSGDDPDAQVQVLLPEHDDASAVEVLERLMSPPLFPITPHELRGDWSFGDLADGEERKVEGFSVLARRIPHKGGPTIGLRVDDGAHSVAYLPDHAPHDLGPGPAGVGPYHDAAMALAHDVDVLIHDAQYTRAELATRGHWGHAAAEYAVGLGEAAGVGRVLLFHHDPARSDVQVHALRDEVARGATVPVEVAVQGAVVQL